MGRYRVIHQNKAWLGKWMYRATSNGMRVNLQELHVQNSTWKTIRSISFEDWESWSESVNLDDPYNDNLGTFKNFVLEQA